MEVVGSIDALFVRYTDPQAFLNLLLGEGQVRYLAHLPEKVDGDYAIVDTLLDTEIIEDGSFLLVHLESETHYDAEMGERLLEYNQKVRSKEVQI